MVAVPHTEQTATSASQAMAQATAIGVLLVVQAVPQPLLHRPQKRRQAEAVTVEAAEAAQRQVIGTLTGLRSIPTTSARAAQVAQARSVDRAATA